MAKDLFNRYIWLVDTIYRAGKITFEEINEKWQRNEMSGGEELPLKTFHNHRHAVQDIFDINIECNRRGGYYYYIENADDMEKGGVRTWLLNTFAVNNLINESHHLKRRILFENIPSGQRFLTPIIEAMRDGSRIEMTYRDFWKEKEATFAVEPYCVKVFRQRWYMVARNVGMDVIRIYALDRIQALGAADGKFTCPKDFDAEEYFYNSFGIIVDAGIPAEIIKIKVMHNQQKFVRSLPLHHSQTEIATTDEYSVFRYYLAPTYDFRQEILSHGGNFEVLEPEHLRQDLKSIADSMADMYR